MLKCGKHGCNAKDNHAPNKRKDTITRLELQDNIINKLYSILNKNHNSCSTIYSWGNQFKIKDKSKGNNSTYSGSKNTDCTYDNPSINVISNSNKEVFFDIIEHIEYKGYKKKILERIKKYKS